MISLMINKYVLLRVVKPYFNHICHMTFWRIHMITVYMIYLFLTYACVLGDFPTTYCTYIILKGGGILYIRDINFKVMHGRGS